MKTPENKLDDIKAKQVFTVPDGYFDKLPLKIQERVVKSEKEVVFKFPGIVKYALAVVTLTIAVILWMQKNNLNSTQDVQQLLAEIPTTDIIDYLEDSDVSLADIIESMDHNESVFDSHMDDLDTISQEDLSIYLEDYELTGEYL